MAPLIPIAMQLAQYVPGIIKLLGGDKAGEVAGKVVDVARGNRAALAASLIGHFQASLFQRRPFAWRSSGAVGSAPFA